jgi:hypothetical protein
MKHFLWLITLLVTGCQTNMPMDGSGSQLTAQPDKSVTVRANSVSSMSAPAKNTSVSTMEQDTKRVALVIGNANYRFAPLNNPVNDAQDMRQALRELGFEVIYRENASQQSMEEAIGLFRQKLAPNTVGLFFFSGHGAQVGGDNFLIPIGITELTPSNLKYKSVHAGYVLSEMEQAGNTTNIIILDACRNNPLKRGFKAVQRGLARMDSIDGSLIAYATSPGNVARDGIGRNSPYTESLLKFMRQKGLLIEQMFKQVRIAVKQKTGNQQTPWESSSLTQDFYFAGPGSTSQAQLTQCTLNFTEASYQGQCQNGVPHGKGKMIYPDGQYYQGEFRNGVRHGQGTHYFPDGFKLGGYWVNGKLPSQ